ncbi:unnamed protein product [Didymodactylos carnosus]|uniref:Uncharacterized protein n=1 Tax=Didymodactylos carnosus TaxID=1234261 RepID=A0A815EVP8_9BILA|nr:unnamed protein product [Didymodactylos carnosus]CAF4166004.1 unnamed protein product [Didymodactylos carnosus]
MRMASPLKNGAPLDKQLQAIQLPHNMNVIYVDSTLMSDQWKAKNSRLVVLYIGVPLVIPHLSQLVASHFVLYAMAIKLLHCPKTPEEITLAEQLIDRYCEQAPLVYDQRIELLTLHAHLHLADQAQIHGGLAFTYAYSFKSSIRFIKRKAHGSKSLATQIAYWTNLQCMSEPTKFEIPISTAVNQIDMNHLSIDSYRDQ